MSHLLFHYTNLPFDDKTKQPTCGKNYRTFSIANKARTIERINQIFWRLQSGIPQHSIGHHLGSVHPALKNQLLNFSYAGRFVLL